MSEKVAEKYLLQDILKKVSRSFYLTLAILPSAVSRQVGLAYLFARAADTIADTGQIERSDRLMRLQQFKSQFLHEQLNWNEIGTVQTMMAPLQSHLGERALLENLEPCFHMFQELQPDDQQAIRNLLPMLIGGMEMDLTVFPGDSESTLTALPSFAELDHYTYSVAGCVGEYWTNVMCAHLPRMRVWDLESKIRAGIRFGKGLQLTNILKDLSKDLRRGRCYIPISDLRQVGLEPQDLLNKRNRKKLYPVLQKLIGIALDHLDQGWLYTLSIPRAEVRLRLACMWPILIGLKTLQLLSTTENLLDPDQNLKIPRWQVYRILASTTLSGGCGYVGTAYWGHFRKAMG